MSQFNISEPQLSFQDGLPSSKSYNDIYFFEKDPVNESLHNFINNASIADWEKETLSILELGLGTGLNFILSLNKLAEDGDRQVKTFHYTTIEKHPVSIHDLRTIHLTLARGNPQLNDAMESFQINYPIRHGGFHKRIFQYKNIQVHLHYLFCDISTALKQLVKPQEHVFDRKPLFDVVYLDGFNRKHNNEMWQADVIDSISSYCSSQAQVVSFSITGDLKNQLRKNGFEITRKKGFGSKHQCLHAKRISPIDPIENIANVEKKYFPWFLTPSSASKRKEISVIGAGLAGCSIAYSLAIRGYKVKLYDSRDAIAMKTSGNIAGVVYPIMSGSQTIFERLSWAAYSFALNRFKKIQVKHDINWNPIGVLQLAKNEKQVERFQKSFAYWENILLDRGQHIKLYSASDLKDLGLNSKIAIEFLRAGSVSPYLLCNYLASHENISFYANHKYEYLKRQQSDDYLLGFNHKHKAIEVQTSKVVFAMADKQDSVEELDWLKLRKNWGQLVVTNFCKAKVIKHKIVCHNYYTLPLKNDLQLYGASKRIHKSDKQEEVILEESNNLIKEFYDNALGITTAEKDFLIKKQKAGCRVSVADHLPIIGALPNLVKFTSAFKEVSKGPNHLLAKKKFKLQEYHQGLYTISALGSRGILYSQLGAEILASQINNEILPVDADIAMALAPTRLLLRQFKKN